MILQLFGSQASWADADDAAIRTAQSSKAGLIRPNPLTRISTLFP